MSDLQVDEDVCRKLSLINEHIAIIQKQKSIENKCASDYEQAKNKYDVSSNFITSKTFFLCNVMISLKM